MNLVKKSLLLLVFATGSSHGVADVFVVAHPSVDISGSEVRDVFLGDKQFAGPVKLVPVDNGVQQEEFLSRALRIDGNRYNSTWTKKSFREGLNPPTMKANDAAVLDFVRRTPGAIGYVGSMSSGVRLVHKF